jgi:hypothetical protein
VRRRQHVDRTRGGSGTTIGVTQQPAGKQEANKRGGICRQESADPQEDKKQQQCGKTHCDNQPEAPADKRWRRLESQGHRETMRGGNCASRGQEKEAARCKYNWGGWMRKTRGNVTTSQGKLER